MEENRTFPDIPDEQDIIDEVGNTERIREETNQIDKVIKEVERKIYIR